MKKIFLLSISGIMLFGCSGDDSGSGSNAGNGQGGSLATFVLNNNYLYAVDEQHINVFSITNGNTPTIVGDVGVDARVETLFAQGNYLYVGTQSGMFIYSISTPQHPQFVSSAQHLTSCDPVVSNGPVTFVTLHSNSNCGNGTNLLQIYDTSNVNHPSMITAVEMVQPKGLGLYGHYLFVCDDVVKVFDVQDPANPVLVHSIDISCHDVIIHGNDLFAIGDSALYRYSLNPNDITNTVSQSNIVF